MNKQLKSKNNQTNLIPKLSNTVRLLGEILGLVIKNKKELLYSTKLKIFVFYLKQAEGVKTKKKLAKHFKN